MSGDLLVERDGYVATVTLNRPEQMNAFTPAMIDELEALWPDLGRNDDVRAVVITGTGDRAFCSGADMRVMSERAPTRDPSRPFPRVTPRHNGVFKPVIAAVNGVCAGAGFQFIADAEIVLAADHATFLDPHVSVGQVSALEPIALAYRIPVGAVLRMVVLGNNERLDARRAYELGLVSEVLPKADVLPRARELASLIAKASPRAVQLSLRAIWEGLNRGLEESMHVGWEIAKSHWGHPDASEGPLAFAEKRAPRWTP